MKIEHRNNPTQTPERKQTQINRLWDLQNYNKTPNVRVIRVPEGREKGGRAGKACKEIMTNHNNH